MTVVSASEGAFDFDHEFDRRREVPSLKYHKMVIGETCSSSEEDHLFVAGVADMDFSVAPCIQDALQQRLKHPLFGYEAVSSSLYPSFCEWMRRRHGWNVQEEHILRAPNVLNSLAMALCSFTEPGDAVIVQPPVFFDFFDIIAENHRTLLENPLRYNEATCRYSMDIENLQDIAPKAKILFLCNPHNPIGRVWSTDELHQLAKICRENNVLIVSDEIHGDLCYSRKFTPMACVDAENTVTLTSPAKTFNIASCCSAFTIISNESLRRRMQAENSKLTVSKNNAFASVAMEAAYRDGETWLDAVLEYLTGNIQLLRERLDMIPGIRLVEPEGTFLLWLDCQGLSVDDSDGYALRQWFRNQAFWAVTRGAAFGRQGHGFVRVNVACPRQQLERALDRLEAAVKKLGL